MQAVILAGGFGTRLAPFTDENPKPMYPFEGKPFLEYLLTQLKSWGIENIVLLLGYLPEKIQDYFGDGSPWGVKITYSVTPVEYDTGFRLKYAKNLLEDDFFLLYCDNYCPIDYPGLVKRFQETGAELCFSAYANEDGYTKSNLRIEERGKVAVYDKKRSTPHLSGVDIGYALVKKQVLDRLPEENHNFEAVVYPQLVAEGKLFAHLTHHRYYSVGSWERIQLTKAFFSGKRYIFLDRDGTLNVRAPQACYIEEPESFVWLPGAKEGVKLLCDAGYQVILITNQPGIARGNLTEETLTSIHEKMNQELQEMGGKITQIYHCPHNWEEGCFCRKPKPGMFYQAQRDFSLDLTRCTMMGDDERDLEAAAAAGVGGVFVSESYPLQQAVIDFLQGEKP